MKWFMGVAAWCLACGTVAGGELPKLPLRVAESGRHLEGADGKAFFWLGDTAWELFHRLSLEESKRYLSDRAEKGFTVVQAVVIAERNGLKEPNANGDLPLVGEDPTKVNEAYLAHVDAVVEAANAAGLVVGMLPTWGSYWKAGKGQGIFSVASAREYGRLLGKRYGEKGVVWILGGDNNVESQAERAIIDAMAEGLKEGSGGRQLCTFHPRGPGLSSSQVHDAAWLDFNMYQSSHAAGGHDNGLFAEHDLALAPLKPTLDGEPRYEALMEGFYFAGNDPKVRFDDFDVRRAAYWSLLAGAAGHTYGNSNIWQMWAPGREAVLGADVPWWEALDHPGAFQMGHVRRLFESRPWWTLRADQGMLADAPRTGGGKVRAARAEDGSFAFFYSPEGAPFTVDEMKLKGQRIRQIWYDPRYGVSHLVHTASSAGFQTFTPPSSGRGRDWVLILEDEAAGFKLPGPPRE